MTHTPGPWIVCGYDDDDWIVENEKDSYPIANISKMFDEDKQTRKEYYANARLCSAAPALLAAVEAMVQAYPYSDIVDGELCTCATCKAYRIGKAAIELTKKEGE